MKRTILHSLFVFYSCSNLFCQTNEFMVGIGFTRSYMRQGNLPYNCNGPGVYTTPTVLIGGQSYPTSPLNVIAEDGFNGIYYFAPSDWDMSETNFYNSLTLVENNNLKLLAFANQWFVPNSPCPGGGCNGVNVYNNFLQGQTNHPSWNNPNAYNKARPNYELLSTNCYKSDKKHVIWGHEINGEGSHRHQRNTTVNPLCNIPGPNSIASETPPTNVSDALGYFKTNLLPPNQKTCLLLANHGRTINDLTNDSEWDGAVTYQNSPNDWNPQNYINQTNKPDVILEASYYQFPINWSSQPYNDIFSADGVHYLGKFKTIDYLRGKGLKVHGMITAELGTYPDYLGHYHSNNLKPNANWLWFQVYTSIIHGVDGIWIYAHDTYSPSLNDVSKKQVFDGQQQDRYKREYFSDAYTNFVSHLGKELRYLVDENFLSSEPSSILYSKLDESDPNCIVPPPINYIPFNSHNSNESYGLRYTIRTNGDEVIMIISNPMNINVTTTLDFTSIGNPIIKNSYGVDVLFTANNAVANTNYKINRNSNINLTSGTVGTQYFKGFTNGKQLNISFGPMDVHILKFTSNPPVSYTNGWEKVWTNHGSGNVGEWNANDVDKYYAGDFDGDGDEELFCVQTGPNNTNNIWMTLLSYDNGKWNRLWSNNGSAHAMLPYRDNFIVGDYNGDGKDELLGNDIDGWTTLFKYENNNWTWAWSNNGASHSTNLYKDRMVSGDFDGDNKDEILGADLPGGWMTMFNFENNNFQWAWSTNGTSHPILSYRNNFRKGDFDANGQDEFLGLSSWATTFNFGNNNFNWSWSTNGSNNFSGWNYPFPATDQILIGNIDSQENREEIMFIQTGTSAAWAATKDLKTDNTGWNGNWFANPSNGTPYINDWPIANNGGTNTRYLLIKAVANQPKYLLALRKYGCAGTNYNYLASMYKSTNGTNKSTIVGQENPILTLKNVEDNWIIFPNPTSGLFHVVVNNVRETSTIEIYNSMGVLIETIVNVSNSEHEVDLSEYSSGLYLVVLRNSSEVYSKKVNYIK